MDIIRTDSARSEYYSFLRQNFPWPWGEYEKFVWKHLKDPFLGENDFYILEQNNNIQSMCVVRKYTFIYHKRAYNVLSMMDFVTASQARNTGKLSAVLQHIYKNIDFDYSIGFSSYQLRETVHRKTKCVQMYYTYLFPPSSSPLTSELCNDEEAILALNSNENAFQIPRTKKYINYIKNNPCYKKIIFLKYDSLVIGVAFEINKENSVRIVELSNYSFEACMIAYKMASIFRNPVKIDLPQKLAKGNFIKDTCFAIFNPHSNYHTIHEGDLIWVPHSDRK